MINFTTLCDNEGNPIAFEGLIRDISELHRTEKKHNADKQTLEASNQQLIAAEQQLQAANQQLEANNQQLIASEQQLQASNQQLVASEQQLQASLLEIEKAYNETKFWTELVTDASVGIVVGYLDGTVGISNKAFQKITGYSEVELKTIAWNTVLTPPEWIDSEMKKLEELHFQFV
mgnify:CR=1 FL=1